MSSPGAWLRLTAIFASGAVLLAVISGAASLGAAHRVLAALALPPLVALVIAARAAHPRLLIPSVGALVLFGIAALVTAPGLHLALSHSPRRSSRPRRHTAASVCRVRRGGTTSR